MNIGIAGTSSFNNYRLFKKIIDSIIKKTYINKINFIILENIDKDDDFLGVNYMSYSYARKHQYNSETIKINFNDYSHPLSVKINKNGSFFNKNAFLIQRDIFLKKSDFIILIHRNELNFKFLINEANKIQKPILNFNLSQNK